jgi:hypothetical protein
MLAGYYTLSTILSSILRHSPTTRPKPLSATLGVLGNSLLLYGPEIHVQCYVSATVSIRKNGKFGLLLRKV